MRILYLSLFHFGTALGSLIDDYASFLRYLHSAFIFPFSSIALGSKPSAFSLPYNGSMDKLIFLFLIVLCSSSLQAGLPAKDSGVELRNLPNGISSIEYFDSRIILLAERRPFLYVANKVDSVKLIQAAKGRLSPLSVHWHKIRLDCEDANHLYGGNGFEALAFHQYQSALHIAYAFEWDKSGRGIFANVHYSRLPRVEIESVDKISATTSTKLTNLTIESISLSVHKDNPVVIALPESQYSRRKPVWLLNYISTENIVRVKMRELFLNLPSRWRSYRFTDLASSADKQLIALLAFWEGLRGRSSPKTVLMKLSKDELLSGRSSRGQILKRFSYTPGKRDSFLKYGNDNSYSLNFEGISRVPKGYLLVNDNDCGGIKCKTVLRFVGDEELP